MNFTQIYMASPDWLKLAWIVLPCATIYGMARVWGGCAWLLPHPQSYRMRPGSRLGGKTGP